MPEDNDSDARISLSEQSLTILANATHPDGYLEELIEQAQDGVGRGVTILTNGMMITGQLAPGRIVAEHFDRDWKAMLDDGSHDLPAEKLAKAHELDGRHAAEWEEGRKERKEWDERAAEVDDPFKDLSAVEAARWISNGVHNYLTLKQVTIVHPETPGSVTRTDLMRVRTASIAAWWPLEMKWKEGRSTFSAFEDAADDPWVPKEGLSEAA